MERWLKSNPVTIDFSVADIDRESGVIRNVVMCEAGPAKGHGVHLEESFIENLVAYDQEHFSKSGVKARFGHPALSDTTMGTQMGYFKDVRKDGLRAIGDLHLLASADKSPTKPGMRDWMLSMAEEASEFVMASIAFIGSALYQYNPTTNEKVELTDYDEWGRLILRFESEKVYVEFDPEKGARHHYTDIVEAGAATNALFSQQFNQDKFAVRTVTWLQENDDILQFIRSNPGKIVEMCAQLQIPILEEMSTTKKTKENFFSHMMAFFSSEAENEAPEVATEETEDAPAPVELTETPPAEATAEAAPATEAAPEEGNQFAEWEARFAALEKQNKELAAQNEALLKKHRSAPAQYNNEPAEGDPRERYLCKTTLAAGR